MAWRLANAIPRLTCQSTQVKKAKKTVKKAKKAPVRASVRSLAPSDVAVARRGSSLVPFSQAKKKAAPKKKSARHGARIKALNSPLYALTHV